MRLKAILRNKAGPSHVEDPGVVDEDMDWGAASAPHVQKVPHGCYRRNVQLQDLYTDMRSGRETSHQQVT